MNQVSKVKRHMKQNSVHMWLAKLDKHQTCETVMVSVVSSIPTGVYFFLLKLYRLFPYHTKLAMLSTLY